MKILTNYTLTVAWTDPWIPSNVVLLISQESGVEETSRSACLRNSCGTRSFGTEVSIAGSKGVRVVATSAEGFELCGVGTAGGTTALLGAEVLFSSMGTEMDGFTLLCEPRFEVAYIGSFTFWELSVPVLVSVRHSMIILHTFKTNELFVPDKHREDALQTPQRLANRVEQRETLKNSSKELFHTKRQSLETLLILCVGRLKLQNV